MYYDYSYLLFVLPALLLSIAAQIWISISFNRNSKISPGNDITGKQAAEIIKTNGKYPVEVVVNGPKLSDHFDPRKDIVSISSESFKSSISNIAVVAHEFGHVDQKFSGSTLFKLRNGIVPIVNIGSYLGYILIGVGLGLNLLNISYLGLSIFALTTLFAFLTVPLELDATRRGLHFLEEYNLIPQGMMGNAKSVLNSAAMTYVAGLFSSIMNVLYYASRIKRRD